MTHPRRAFLKSGLGLAVGAAALGSAPLAMALAQTSVRRLAFDNLHTGEKLEVAYWQNGTYAPDALAEVNHVLRDYRNGEVHPIEPTLLDLLAALSIRLETAPRYSVISGYRSPATNAMLHEQSHQVASGSLHMQGMAIDIRLAGLDLGRVRDAAQSLAIGGVGYYPSSQFVHVDVGRVRQWAGT
jgi:uncharacterized protein YcbK (DUF882 family)